MNNYKKFAAKFCGVELLIIALANIVYYVTANNQEPCISRVQDKTETIYKIIYTQTDDRTWILMDIALGILFLLSVFLICYIGKKIIKPFEQMQSLTEDLAKGNLSVPVKAEKSKFLGRFLWGMDMLRETLENNKEKELALQKEKKTLVLSLTHDIRTPLSAIRLYAKALEEDLYTTGEQCVGACQGIGKNVKEIEEYVNEITLASREDFLQLSVNPGEVYLSHVIDAIRGLYEEKLHNLHTGFQIASYTDLLLKGDADRLIEVLQNLLENAIKYGDGKCISIDFSEEEVEFADRTQLRDTMRQIKERIDALRSSFSLGNAIKEGVAVAIVGAPNVGKSTLLNRLLNEERAMVSDIAGTTRDVIEERANIDGVVFRFLDTAGIRSTNDTLEQMGIARTMSSIERAQIIIRLIDASQSAVPVSGGNLSSGQTGRKSVPAVPSADSAADTQSPDFPLRPDQTLLTVYNKIDKTPRFALPEGAVGISARNGDGIDDLRRTLRDAVDTEALYHGGTVISNSRHYEALTSASEALSAALDGLRDNLPTDLLSEEIRQVIRHLSGVTGQDIVPEEVLKTIFSKFCIGK